jgi:Domain of unknown function (DUF4113)
VLLLELLPEMLVQGHLFERQDTERSKLLMETLDNFNRQFGARTLQYASAGLTKGLGDGAGEAIKQMDNSVE